MKKICLLLVITTLLLTSCSKIYHWEFDYPEEEIEEIKIIDIIDLYPLEYTVLCEIEEELFSDVYHDVEKLNMTKYGWNLAHPHGRCFMIVFNNGDYDIISRWEPQANRYENGELVNYISWLRCNDEEFGNLMNKYLENTVDK